jgi:hypothetical protein
VKNLKMPNPICEKCKQDKPNDTQSAVQQTGCESLYDKVDLCMKENKGVIALCKDEWASFRGCVAAHKNSSLGN